MIQINNTFCGKRHDRFEKDFAYRVHYVKKIAHRWQWVLEKETLSEIHFTAKGFKSTKDGKAKIIFYVITRNIETILAHPKLGNTILLRKSVPFILVEKIFRYPRRHTGEYGIKSKITHNPISSISTFEGL